MFSFSAMQRSDDKKFGNPGRLFIQFPVSDFTPGSNLVVKRLVVNKEQILIYYLYEL